MKFDIGGGQFPYGEGFINVDIRMVPGVELVADLRALPILAGSADEIFCCATLEHLTDTHVKKALLEFHRVLKMGGKLTIAVPDLLAICNSYVNGEVDFATASQYLYGAQAHPFDVHKSIFDSARLKALLEEVGFAEIAQQPYDLPRHIPNLMLKVVCVRDASPPVEEPSSPSPDLYAAIRDVGSFSVLEWANLLAEKDRRILQLQREFEERTAWALALDQELTKIRNSWYFRFFGPNKIKRFREAIGRRLGGWRSRSTGNHENRSEGL